MDAQEGGQSLQRPLLTGSSRAHLGESTGAALESAGGRGAAYQLLLKQRGNVNKEGRKWRRFHTGHQGSVSILTMEGRDEGSWHAHLMAIMLL